LVDGVKALKMAERNEGFFEVVPFSAEGAEVGIARYLSLLIVLQQTMELKYAQNIVVV
jgi:hypothetical protein